MNQILKKRATIIALLTLFITLTNCVDESIDSPNQNNSVTNVKKWFELNKPSLSVLNYTKSIDWNNALMSKGDMGTIIEVPLSLKEGVQAKVGDDNSYQTYNRLMFIADKQGTYKAYHVLITTDNTSFESTSNNNNFYSLEDNFDGYVTVLGAKDKIVNFKKIINGVETKPSLTARAPLTCVFYGWWIDNGVDISFQAIALVGCFSQDNDYPLNYGVSHGGGTRAPSKADKINDSKLDPCLQTILSKLKTLTRGVNQIVVNFAGNTPNYNWNLKSDYLNGPTGSTNPPALYDFSTGSITTTFDSKTWTDATDLSWARTMLHESIHAYLATQFAINKKDFASSYSTMVSEWGVINDWNKLHHEEIARSIVNDVALALEEYGKSNGYNLPSQFYQDMAWGGLQDTITFKSLPFVDQQRILNVISTELTGADINGNAKQQKGKKAGC
jgi:hypothetical protein